MKQQSKEKEIIIPALDVNTNSFRIVGQTGLYCHRMSQTTKRELLIGSALKPRKMVKGVKHDPIQEFQDSLYHIPDAHPRTELFLPSTAIKSAMASASIEIPGIAKTEVNRLLTIEGEYVPLFGIPKLRMDVVRMAGPGRTPDIRTRAFFPSWGSEFNIRRVGDSLSIESLGNLIYCAGILIGLGDQRQEKGKGSFGAFSLSNTPFDLDLLDKEAQKKAIRSPEAYNSETADLLDYYLNVINNM